MSLNASVWLVVVLAFAGANLPFLSQRLLAIWPSKQGKTLWVRLFELLALYVLVGGVALGLEQAAGQIYPQRWEFYATTAALFVTLAFPGFVFRYLFRSVR
jgi:Protein of unknown function (DUF2818)